ncbi:hypothetical protein HP570_20335 [Brevibacillus sp. RS1.1]|uniref:hypothetical protein n=1 Tax=Brevibacillus sp. RS1.1 TaxID=2738982 RepID=UPI00156BADFF|nr:hypothetical protein [Brevibacillus sp. RS1.1]NRR04566.1 hypothetical protein [Brevibacillus sp. RS1.1]
MNLVTIKQAAERLDKAKQAAEKVKRETRAETEKRRLIRQQIRTMGVDPDRLDEAIKQLEQELEESLAQGA